MGEIDLTTVNSQSEGTVTIEKLTEQGPYTYVKLKGHKTNACVRTEKIDSFNANAPFEVGQTNFIKITVQPKKSGPGITAWIDHWGPKPEPKPEGGKGSGAGNGSFSGGGGSWKSYRDTPEGFDAAECGVNARAALSNAVEFCSAMAASGTKVNAEDWRKIARSMLDFVQDSLKAIAIEYQLSPDACRVLAKMNGVPNSGTVRRALNYVLRSGMDINEVVCDMGDTWTDPRPDVRPGAS